MTVPASGQPVALPIDARASNRCSPLTAPPVARRQPLRRRPLRRYHDRPATPSTGRRSAHDDQRVYPRPDADTDLLAPRATGGPPTGSPSAPRAEVDADARLHLPICWYACSLGYAQQEDEVLEATYLNRFREAATIAHDSVMRPWSGQPKHPQLGALPPGRLRPTGPPSSCSCRRRRQEPIDDSQAGRRRWSTG